MEVQHSRFMKNERKKSSSTEPYGDKCISSTLFTENTINMSIGSKISSQSSTKSSKPGASKPTSVKSIPNHVPIPAVGRITKDKQKLHSDKHAKKLILDTNIKSDDASKWTSASTRSDNPRPMTLFSGESSLIKQASAVKSNRLKRNESTASKQDVVSDNGMRKRLKKTKDVHWKDDNLEEIFIIEPEFTGPKQRVFGAQNSQNSVAEPMYEEVSLQETWYEPRPYDFEQINKTSEDRESIAFKRGGSKIAESPESQRQKERESRSLVVFYSSPEEIPKSPAEPPMETVQSGPENPIQIPLSSQAAEELKIYVSQALRTNH